MKEFDYSSSSIINTIQEDYFHRNIRALNLIDMICNTDDCMAFAIDAPWGSGKTVFVNQLKELINNNSLYEETCKRNDHQVKDTSNITAFYFNAWEKNLVKNPAINLLKSLIEDNGLDVLQENKLKNVAEKLTNIGIKIATAGVLELNDFTENKNKNVFLSVETVKDTFKEAIDELKKSLNKEKIVVIIDELDRCKPIYAVEMLENLKHFYNEAGIVFIVSTDINQLTHTIKKMYGTSFDADLYLQRFFEAIFTLNNASYERYIMKELSYNIIETNTLSEVVKVSILHYKLSIREINKYIKHIKLIEKDLTGRDSFYKDVTIVRYLFIPWALALRYKNSSLFSKFRKGEFSEDEFKAFFACEPFLAIWVSQVANGEREEKKTEEIQQYFFELYKYIFRDESLRLYDDINNSREEKFAVYNKEYLMTLIDF